MARNILAEGTIKVDKKRNLVTKAAKFTWTQHVMPYDSVWAVIGKDNTRPTSVHRTQAEAIDAAREIARSQRSELVVHRADGRIRERYSYRDAPLPPKSPREVLFPPTPGVTDPDKIRRAVREVLSERGDRGGLGSDPFPPRDRRH